MRELLPLDHPASLRAPAHVREMAVARADPRTRILHLVWDASDGCTPDAIGFEQWSVRPYHLGQGCDGTIEENMHFAAIQILAGLGLDYRAIYRAAYPGSDLDAWPTPEFAATLGRETVLPSEPVTLDDLNRLLRDLYDTNHRTLEELVREGLESIGRYPPDPSVLSPPKERMTDTPILERKYPDPTTPEPDIEDLQEWADDGWGEATDGCDVEADGTCEHGHPSWLKALGMI